MPSTAVSTAFTAADVADAFELPAAVLDSSGAVVAWNAAWDATAQPGRLPELRQGADFPATFTGAVTDLAKEALGGLVAAVLGLEDGAPPEPATKLILCGETVFEVRARRLAAGALITFDSEHVRATEERISQVFAAAPVGVVAVNMATAAFMDMNDAFLQFCGYEREELLGKTAEEIGLWVHASERETMRRDLMAHGSLSNTEVTYRRRDGSHGQALCSWEVTEMFGQPCVVTTAIDITERARAESELRTSEERFRLLAENAGDIIVRLSPDGRVLYASSAIERVLGRSPGSILGDEVVSGANPDDLPLTTEAFARAAGGESVTFDARQRHADGHHVWLETCVWPMFDPVTGKVTELHALSRDVSERKLAQEALSRSEERFRALVQHSSDITTISDPTGTILYASPSVEASLGYPPADVEGLNILSFIHPDDLASASESFWTVSQGPGVHKPLELRVRHRDGSWRVVSTVANNLLHNPAIGGIVHHSRDVTEALEMQEQRRQAVEQLQSAHRNTRRLLASVPAVLIAVDTEGVVTLWNGAAEATFGWTADEMDGRKLDAARISPEPDEITVALAECLASRMPQRRELVRFRRADGAEGLMAIVVNPIIGDAQGVAGMLIAAVDVTEQVSLHLRLTQAQKLESLGQIAAGIAHEINTPMQFIGDNLEYMREAFADLTGPASEAEKAAAMTEIPLALEQSAEGVRRVVQIVQAMKALTHPGASKMAPCDLNAALETALTMTANEWKYVATVERDLDASLPLAECYEANISQVFVNILVNAAHAIADNRKCDDDALGLIGVRTRALGDRVEVRISDTGGGIDEEIQGRLFDPFFTTKDVGRGTGQGLAIAHSVVVQEHSGTLHFETEPGKGSTFVITLPIGRQGNREGQ